MVETAIVLLAGGEAKRLPGKLERDVAGTPLLLHVYERLRGARPVYVAGRGSFGIEIDRRLECPVLVDRWPGRGPLAALLSACGSIDAPRVFAVAADLPNVDLNLVAELERAVQPGDEAVVPRHDERIEPLAALYDRAAVLDRGYTLLASGRASMRDLVGALNARFVTANAERFFNVNTPADLEYLA